MSGKNLDQGELLPLTVKEEHADEKTSSCDNKRCFMLISRKIAPIKNSVTSDSTKWTDFRMIKKTCVRKLPIKISHRVCQICRTIKPIAEISMVTDEFEKLFILLSVIFRQKLLISMTARLYKQPAVYACHSHFAEASSEIFTMLGVNNTAKILQARSRKVGEVEKLVKDLTGKSIERKTILSLAYLFVVKHPESATVFGPLVKEEEIPVEETVECLSVMSPEKIVPKCFRQPRKQRLEDDGCSSSLFRIIKKDTLNLPTQPDCSAIKIMENPFQCCFCLEFHEKHMLLQLPVTQHRLDKWVAHLGEEFRKRLQRTPNFMCRKHFSKLDFSTRGRLLRGALPNVVPQEEVHTFKIEGNDFLAVREPDLKIELDGDIDIEN